MKRGMFRLDDNFISDICSRYDTSREQSLD